MCYRFTAATLTARLSVLGEDLKQNLFPPPLAGGGQGEGVKGQMGSSSEG